MARTGTSRFGARARQGGDPHHRPPRELGAGRHPARAAQPANERGHARGTKHRTHPVARQLPAQTRHQDHHGRLRQIRLCGDDQRPAQQRDAGHAGGSPVCRSGTPVRFFGRETLFSTAPALLWQHTGATVLPAFVLQNAKGRYLSFADTAIPMERHDDQQEAIAKNTQLVATAFEAIIREHPEQWFNYVPIWK